jgi:hypothetical protein
MNRSYAGLFLCLTIGLTACLTVELATESQPAPATVTQTATATIEITPTFDGCYYVWATQDLPDLSRQFQAELQKVMPKATGGAYASGEDCVYADGHRTFGAMETDFRVQVPAKDLKDQKALGNWILQTLQIIEKLPSDELAGNGPGMVEIDFVKDDGQDLHLNVSFEKYQADAKGLTGAQLFRFFFPAR